LSARRVDVPRDGEGRGFDPDITGLASESERELRGPCELAALHPQRRLEEEQVCATAGREEFSEKVSQYLTRPHQTFVEIPYASHNTLSFSPVKTPGEDTCGLQIAAQFIDDPKAALDTSCTADTRPPNLRGDPGITQLFFGVDSLLGD
jgi:hypothetical protein